MEIRNLLNIKEGDKISFIDRDGEIIINNASANTLLHSNANANSQRKDLSGKLEASLGHQARAGRTK